jgi:hypothetical protein
MVQSTVWFGCWYCGRGAPGSYAHNDANTIAFCLHLAKKPTDFTLLFGVIITNDRIATTLATALPVIPRALRAHQ